MFPADGVRRHGGYSEFDKLSAKHVKVAKINPTRAEHLIVVAENPAENAV
jgi:hypothetical protein